MKSVKVNLSEQVSTLNEELINKAEAMTILDLSQAGFWNLVKRGELNVYEISSFKLYSKVEVTKLNTSRAEIAKAKAAQKVVDAKKVLAEAAK